MNKQLLIAAVFASISCASLSFACSDCPTDTDNTVETSTPQEDQGQQAEVQTQDAA